MIRSLTQDMYLRCLVCTALVVGVLAGMAASAATIRVSVETTVTDPTTNQKTIEPVNGFRYLVEEDTTYKPNVGVVDNLGNPTSLSFNFHKSHTPVAVGADGSGISGESSTNTADIVVPDNGNYFVSVLPFSGHTMGGGAVSVGSSIQPVNKTIRVSRYPLPAAQLSVWVFQDNNPLNGAIDIAEVGLQCEDTNRNGTCEANEVPFSIKLFDAAGQYGAAGGHVTWDIYGNPLGTEYDANGDIISVPEGDAVNGFVLHPDANGQIIIKNLPPAKYGVEVVPPAGAGWIQTSTIEGSKTIDAWVKANEPPIFVEFGPPGPHVFVGFIKDYDCVNAPDANCDPDIFTPPAAGTGVTLTGQVVNNHLSRPPNFQFSNGELFEGCRIGINLIATGRTIVSKPCGEDAIFEINNLPAGSYSLSIYDDGLNIVIANHLFTISQDPVTSDFSVQALYQNPFNPGGAGQTPSQMACVAGVCDLQQVPVFDWFHFLDTFVFNDLDYDGQWDWTDANANGVFDPLEGESPLHADASATNLRFRDGRIYDSLAIDFFGNAPLEEVFPFFHWLVAEVDFGNYKSTGATFISDAGGYDSTLPDYGLVPQVQDMADACKEGDDTTDIAGCSLLSSVPSLGLTGQNIARAETGVVLTEAFQGFLGQKNIALWGKAPYGPEQNGGISGVAVYAITRAEDDPRYAAAEEWEPGIPRVQFALFDVDSTAVNPTDAVAVQAYLQTLQQPDVDNYPLGWADGGEMGPEDIDNNTDANGGTTGVFDLGDASRVTWSDSWDDSLPTNCQGANNLTDGVTTLDDHRCFDGLRNWNQMRPGVFDGGYAFGGDSGAPDVLGADHLNSGYYIVQAFAPQGYQIMTEEDKNVDFGDEVVPQLLPPECVGAPHEIRKYLSQVTDPAGNLYTGIDPSEDLWSPYYSETSGISDGVTRPLCDAKLIRVAEGKNAAADFHFTTNVMKAAHVVGGVINDFGNEFNPASPNFGEKFAPPWLPVAFYDWEGNEINRVYTDQFGKYNAMLPSTYSVNVSSPSGVSPHMISACMNDAGLVDTDGDGVVDTPDPRHNPQYSQFCYTFQYMPGGTTYLDTPVTQLAAFAGSGYQLDCDAATETPMIAEVTSGNGMYHGPYVDSAAASEVERTLTITSVGVRSVPNPNAGVLAIDNVIERDYGFGGTAGQVWLRPLETWGGGANVDFPLTVPTGGWSDAAITAVVPSDVGGDAPRGRYQLEVVHANGNVSPMGTTVIVGPTPSGRPPIQVEPSSVPGATPIQAAIDGTPAMPTIPGDVILVAAGTYDEIPILDKPLYLQGAGAYSTMINARPIPTEKVQNWQDKIYSLLVDEQAWSLLSGQELANPLFPTEAGAGITVVGLAAGGGSFGDNSEQRATIDGFRITGASTGGGIFVNGYARGLQISNNLIDGNEGTYGGGIRIGHYNLTVNGENAVNTDAQNDNIWIHHNAVTRNGISSELGAGAGIALYTGSDNYLVSDNLVCGNFSSSDGGGIAHMGYSNNGLIEDNRILFNQSFRQTAGLFTNGGGVVVQGYEPLVAGGQSEGTGKVTINRNLIQGNQAGAGDGGGIEVLRATGQDLVDALARPGRGNVHGRLDKIFIYNNTIVNNHAGGAGGGISVAESMWVDIWSNTIVNNISTSTAGTAFNNPATPAGVSAPATAGIVSHAYTGGGIGDLVAANQARLGKRWQTPFPNLSLENNAIWHNRPYHYDINAIPALIEEGFYSDLGVQGGAGTLDPQYCLLSDATGYGLTNLDDGVISGDPFVTPYLNGDPGLSPSSPSEFTTVQAAPALDEGGNWIDVRYAPLSVNDVDRATPGDQPSDYHLATVDLVDAGSNATRPGELDIDLEPGNAGNGTIDIGSDEVQP